MSNQGNTARQLIISILLVTIGGLLGYKLRGNENIPGLSPLVSRFTQTKFKNTEQPTQYKDVNFGQFWDVWKILDQNYIDPEKMKPETMVDGAIKGMTASLGDPYTMYLPPDDQKRSQEDLQGSFGGVGIQLDYVDNVLAVGVPLKGSPAEKAGIKAKDLILHIKDDKTDKDTDGMSMYDAMNLIRGQKGTQVTLTLLRPEEKKDKFPVTLTRDEIIIPFVELAYIDLPNGKKVAHIILSRFGDTTQHQLDDIIIDIRKQSPKVSGIILDMRNNPGGYLDGAVDVASEFIKDGLIVTQQGRTSSHQYMSKGYGRLADYPINVVVNGGSASAAEIVAGALRDRKGAQLIGEKTFGKGTVQDALQLPSGAGLHVTIAKWILPKGDWIQKTGIPVNTEVKDDKNTPADEVIDKAKQEFAK